jgi:hypothetical protein
VEQICNLAAGGDGDRGADASARIGAMNPTKWLPRQEKLLARFLRQELRAPFLEPGMGKEIRPPNEDQRKRFYRALLQIPWLARGVRRAIHMELGSSPVQHQRAIKRAEIKELRELVELHEARMRWKRERPRGGIHDAALNEIAELIGLSSGAALKKQFQRYK